MDPASKSIKSLIDQFMGGDIQLPEIQREYVWSREKVCALIDSIHKGYPSGSILLWRTDLAGATRPAAAADADDSIAPSHLLLDGQQRLTSLAAVMKGTPVEMRVRGSIVEAPIEVYFNMDHPDETPEPDDTDDDADYAGVDSRMFQLKNHKVESDRRWIPMASLFQKGPRRALMENGLQDGWGAGREKIGPLMAVALRKQLGQDACRPDALGRREAGRARKPSRLAVGYCHFRARAAACPMACRRGIRV